jgi:uncharacterized protein
MQILLTLLMLIMGCGLAEEVNFPNPQPGYVHDFANVLSPNVKLIINNQLRAADKAGITKMAVVTVPTLNGMDIADYTIQLGKKWKVGNKKSDNGVILLVAVKERKVRLEVGYGNEAVIPDITAKTILSEQVTPFLKKNDFNRGIQSGVDHVILTLTKREG